MPVAARSWMAAGVAAISASAIVAAPTLRPLPAEATTTSVRLTAAQTITPEMRALVAAAQQLVAPQNAATNAVDYAYSVITYWTDYGVELADYALQFVPFGGLISSQINIIYPQVIGVTDSVVYDLIDPVLENPLDITAYIDGLIDVAVTTVNALVNVVVGEADYFLGWLIPPLPPLPLAASADVEEEPELELQKVDLEDAEQVQEVEEVAEVEVAEVDEEEEEEDVAVDLADVSDDEDSGGAEVATPEQPGGGSDSDSGEDQDAEGHDVTPAEDDVPAGPTESEGGESGEKSPQGQGSEAA